MCASFVVHRESKQPSQVNRVGVVDIIGSAVADKQRFAAAGIVEHMNVADVEKGKSGGSCC